MNQARHWMLTGTVILALVGAWFCVVPWESTVEAKSRHSTVHKRPVAHKTAARKAPAKKTAAAAKPATAVVKSSVTLSTGAQNPALQQQFKRLQSLEQQLYVQRSAWYGRTRDVAFLQQIIQEAQLTLDLDVASHGARLIFLEEYGSALDTEILNGLFEGSPGSLRGKIYTSEQVTGIRNRGREILGDLLRQQVSEQERIKKTLDDIEAAAAQVQELREAELGAN